MLTIGFQIGGWRHSGFIDAPNFNEFDVILWHASITLSEVSSSLNSQTVASFNRQLARLSEWVSRGHTLIVVVTPLRSFQFVSGRTQISLRLEDQEPFKGVSFEQAAGELIDFCGPDVLREILTPALTQAEYSVILACSGMKPLFKVSKGRFGSDQIVGVIKRMDKGLVIFAPPLRKDTMEPWPSIYYGNLAQIPDLLRTAISEELPTWVTNFQTDNEKAAHDGIDKLEAQISTFRLQVEEQQGIIQADQYLKQLFAGSGDAFAASVSKALGELGLKTVEGPRGRADLIGYDGTRVSAFEVKGLDGSAREHNLRQTERWVADIKSALTATEEQMIADGDFPRHVWPIAPLGQDDPVPERNRDYPSDQPGISPAVHACGGVYVAERGNWENVMGR
jgi:hypothetical protein